MSARRTAARLCALPLAAGLGLLAAAPASAHVTITPEEGTAGSYTVLTVSVPHGCEGSPTNKVAIQMPEQLLDVTPTRNPLWDVKKVMDKLDRPVTDAHGSKVTERVGQVVYTTDDPLPEGYRDSFELSLQLPEDAAGETLTFPTIQSCTQGRTAWVQTAAAGQSADDLEAPAPTVTVLPADGGAGHGSGGSDAEQSAQQAGSSGGGDTGGVAGAAPASADAAAEESSSSAWGVSGLVAGLLGLAAGVTALVMVRRRA